MSEMNHPINNDFITGFINSPSCEKNELHASYEKLERDHFNALSIKDDLCELLATILMPENEDHVHPHLVKMARFIATTRFPGKFNYPDRLSAPVPQNTPIQRQAADGDLGSPAAYRIHPDADQAPP